MAQLPNLSGLNLPQQAAPTGGAFDLFDAKFNGTGFATAVYVYAVEPHTGVVRFGMARKVPPGRRLRKHGAAGAAGTNAKYHGKWVSLGGGSDKDSKHPLDAAVRELSDEAFFTQNNRPALNARADVHIPDEYRQWTKLRGTPAPSPSKERLRLKYADQIHSKVFLFCFEMEYTDFISLFPDVDDAQNVRGGQGMVTASHGEIDSCASFTLEQLLTKQMAAVNAASPNNFFTDYTLRSLRSVLKNLIRYTRTAQAKLAYTSAMLVLNQLGMILQDAQPREPKGWRDKVMYKG